MLVRVGGAAVGEAIALRRLANGAISAQIPDNTTAGGQARGAGAQDFQIGRLNANQVAAGQNAGLIGTRNSRAAGDSSLVAGGQGSTVTGAFSVAVGGEVWANFTGSNSVGLGGRFNQLNSNEAVVLGGFLSSTRGIDRLIAWSGAGRGVGAGDCHGNSLILRGTASGNIPLTLVSNDSTTPAAANQFMLQNNSAATLFVATQALLTNGSKASWFHVVHVSRGANAASTTVDLLTQIAANNTIGAILSIDGNTTLGCLRVVYTGSSGETAYVQAAVVGGFQFF
jgi:hypothetical protein